MSSYKCFFCGKTLSVKSLKERFVCPYCGNKVFFKPRTATKKVKAV